MTGDSLGTIRYLSPEQVADAKRATATSDIYSLSIVLIEMLLGEPDITLLDLSDLDGEIKVVLRKGCSQEPTQRYQNTFDLIKSLKQGKSIQKNEGVALCPNVQCDGVAWCEDSFNYGEFVKPYVRSSCTDSFCNLYGTELKYSCNCGGGDLSQPYCTDCGEELFHLPACSMCGTEINVSDRKRDIEKEGCSRCSVKHVNLTQQSFEATVEDCPF